MSATQKSKKTKDKKKQGISHIQNSMEKLISNLGGSTLGQPLHLSDSSTSLESDTIEVVVDAAEEVVDAAEEAEEVVEENNDTNKDD